ncbi:MAG: SLOG family protein [Eubacteriales bacterium]
MTVTFIGHRYVSESPLVQDWLENTVVSLINRGASEFLLGGYGSFDGLSAKVVKKLQATYPDIKSYLVIPYLDQDFNENLYDNSIYPPLETVPKRFAISKRNEWMVDEADVVVAYIKNYAGGSGRTMEYAERKKKEILRYESSA